MSPHYLSFLDSCFYVLSLVFLISGIEDLFVDVCFICQKVKQWISPRQDSEGGEIRCLDHLRSLAESKIAIMVPAWQEEAVIAQMLRNNTQTLEYENYLFFVGCYQNDQATQDAVDSVMGDLTNVRKVIVREDGPTCKADCLNWIMMGIREEAERSGVPFRLVIMHDAEDLIHPLELKLFNAKREGSDLIQLPVRPLIAQWNHMVGGTYMDEFAETHTKDMSVRSLLCGIVPSAGVGTAFSAASLMALAEARGGHVFNIESLTEDYDISYTLAPYTRRETFERVYLPVDAAQAGSMVDPAEALVAVEEYFPTKFWSAVRQRTRWNIGIFYQGFSLLVWRGNFFLKYYFFRDRKGIVTNLLALPAYLLMLNILIVFILSLFGLCSAYYVDIPMWMIYLNLGLLGNRIIQRMIFTGINYGLLQSILSLPRIFIANALNCVSTFRATVIFIKSKFTHKPIGWDKTSHTYPDFSSKKL